MALSLTPSAADRVREMTTKDGAPRWLRVAVRGGGCSGLQYHLDFVEAPKEGDRTYQFGEGVQVCVDKKSYLFLNGTELHFERSLLKTGFVFNNPIAQKSCSCGESFSV